MQFSDSDIIHYYDSARSHYSYFWKLNEAHSLHYGYWDNSTKSFTDALLKINAVMADRVGIKDGMRVLDTGCGEGGSVAWLAAHFDMEVTGITLSKKQCETGNALLASKNLGGKIEVANYCKTHFPDNHFDVVWAIESVCHASDKRAYLKEMFRILKPGGRLVLADFFAKKELNGAEQKAMNSWSHAWAVPSFESAERFADAAKTVGFEEVNMEDISNHVVKSVKRLYRMFYIGLPGSLLYNILFPKTSTSGKRNVYSAYWQYNTFKKKLWKYQLVSLRK
jgi:tocopherol O-methyltransferase